jgi:hypothetical protein
VYVRCPPADECCQFEVEFVLHTPAQIGLIWPNGKRGSGSETASAGQNLERCPTEPSTPVAGQVEQKEEEGGRGRQKSSGQRLYVSQRKERKSRDAYLEAKTGHLSTEFHKYGNAPVLAPARPVRAAIRWPSATALGYELVSLRSPVRGDMRIFMHVMPPATAGSGPRAPSLPHGSRRGPYNVGLLGASTDRNTLANL